ncbi:hypothetical protein BC826DRAFT_1034237 [Russula brevipes]|nr:hypothetical protein BC826DRAFT_1034237 [Russula brevipes]
MSLSMSHPFVIASSLTGLTFDPPKLVVNMHRIVNPKTGVVYWHSSRCSTATRPLI